MPFALSASVPHALTIITRALELSSRTARMTTMRRTCARFVLALSFIVTLSPSRATAQGRPLVLLVHGRGLVGRDTASARKDWLEALQAGVASLGVTSPIAPQDFRVVWYADALDVASGASCDYAADDPRARRDAKEDSNFKTLIALAGGLLNLVSSSVDGEASLQTRALAADAAFLADARKRCAAEQRLDDALAAAKRDGRPVILVAHSLGAVAAYDELSARKDTNVVHRFITLGSPLGSQLYRTMLIGGDSADVVVKPVAVRDWANVRHLHDDLAFGLSIARDTVVAPPADESDPHELLGYLRDSTTVREILSGWCGAFVGPRPQGCNGVVSK